MHEQREDDWIRATSVAPDDLYDSTLQLHWAVQFLASAGQTFAEPRDDDSHRAMLWSHELRAFVGEPFAGAYPFRLGLRPADLTLVLLDRQDGELSSFPLRGRTREEGYEWLAVGMATYLGGAPPEIERPEYDMPSHEVSDASRFGSDRLLDDLAALEALYDGAHTIIRDVLGGESQASPVRCWPHHFDIASLITVEEDDNGAATRTVGVGLAPMGGGYDGWYWYVSPWPAPGADRLGPLEGPAAWHTEGWTGAVLPGRAVADVAPEKRADLVRRFLDQAIPAARAALREASQED